MFSAQPNVAPRYDNINVGEKMGKKRSGKKNHHYFNLTDKQKLKYRHLPKAKDVYWPDLIPS